MLETKTCSLTENEIKQLIIWHGYNLNDEGKDGLAIENMDDRIERIAYLNRRLKAEKKEGKSETEHPPAGELKPVEQKDPATW